MNLAFSVPSNKNDRPMQHAVGAFVAEKVASKKEKC